MAKLPEMLKSVGGLAIVGLAFAAWVETSSFQGDWRIRPGESGPSAVAGELSFGRRSRGLDLETECDVYEGYYRRGLGSVTISGLGPASERCAEDEALLASLNGVARYRYGLQSMTLSAPDGSGVKLFRPQ